MRNTGLDLLRFVAVALVLGAHLRVPTDRASGFLELWVRGGWIGVDIFFVLSGFLISGLIFKEYDRYGRVDIPRFLIRRGFKIYPPFYVMIGATVAFLTFKGHPPSMESLLGELFFLQNYVGKLWRHTWSLAVEEHFYLGFALFVAALLERRQDRPFSVIPRAFVYVAVFCLLLRLLTMPLFDYFVAKWQLFGTHIRVDSLFFGVLLSYLVRYKGLSERLRKVPSILFLAIGLALFAPAFGFSVHQVEWVSVLGVVGFYLGAGAVLLAAIRIQSTDQWALKVFASIGRASYSVYLWHLFVNDAWQLMGIREFFPIESFWAYFAYYLLGSVLVGYLMSLAVERPMLRLRDRFFPPRDDPRKLQRSQGEASAGLLERSMG